MSKEWFIDSKSMFSCSFFNKIFVLNICNKYIIVNRHGFIKLSIFKFSLFNNYSVLKVGNIINFWSEHYYYSRNLPNITFNSLIEFLLDKARYLLLYYGTVITIIFELTYSNIFQ